MVAKMLTIPAEVEEHLKEMLLPVCALERDGRFNLLGTAAVIGGQGRQAILLSAMHTFEYIDRIDKPYTNYSSSPFAVHKEERELKHTHMHSFLRQGKNAYGVLIQRVWGAGTSDLAIALAELQQHVPETINFRKGFAIDTTPIVKGEKVHLAGFSTMTHQQEQEADGMPGRNGKIELGHSIYECVAQEVYRGRGPRNEPDPCFKINTAINSGMSGAPVLKGLEQGRPTVCGVAGMDGSYRAGEEGIGSGENALAWQLRPILGVMVDMNDGAANTRQPFLELIKRGLITDHGDAGNRASIVLNDDGSRTIKWC